MNGGYSPLQTLQEPTPVIRHKCGCELLILASGIPIGRKRCKDAERLHRVQASLSKRLMTVREGSEDERKIIARIEHISDALAEHRNYQNQTAHYPDTEEQSP